MTRLLRLAVHAAMAFTMGLASAGARARADDVAAAAGLKK
jgi:hypothetical protein